MSKRKVNLLIEDMIESGESILEYTKGMSFDEFLADKKSKDAVIRNFEIIGEAGNRLPEDFIIKNHQINWDQIRGLRNRIVHDYFGIDYSIIWNIKDYFLPTFLQKLKEINSEKI